MKKSGDLPYAVSVVPFFKPYVSGREMSYLQEAIASGRHSGDGPFTERCHALLEARLDVPRALLTTSCTTALEMAAILARGDHASGPPPEVIVPAFTFVSTVNAFLLHGYKPVFADIREDTCNLDETRLERHITPQTRAIVPVHYAGVPCEMDAIQEVATRHDLVVVEDAAQAIFSTYRGRPAGSLGDLGCFSFHGTKNLSCGEGGALVFRDAEHIQRAEWLREKGTNRQQFLRGEIDRYTWVDVGGSYLPSDLLSAYLLAQLEAADTVHRLRATRVRRYRDRLQPLHDAGHLRLPNVPAHVKSNHHLFHILLRDTQTRDGLMAYLKKRGIHAVFHYGALHLSPMGQRFGPPEGALPVAESAAERLLRLPLYPDLTDAQVDEVTDALCRYFDVATVEPVVASKTSFPERTLPEALLSEASVTQWVPSSSSR